MTKFNECSGVFSIHGFIVVDHFVTAAAKAGASLVSDSFIKAADSLSIAGDIFGSAPATFSSTKRLASSQSGLSQIVDGR